MWSPPGLNVESYVEPLSSRRSGVVAQRPPRPLVHLSQISGPVRSFFFLFCLFSGISCACRRAVCGETEGAAPSGFEAAFVLDHGDGFLDGVSMSVAFVVCGSPEGDVLVGVEQVGWDADHAVRALFD